MTVEDVTKKRKDRESWDRESNNGKNDKGKT